MSEDYRQGFKDGFAAGLEEGKKQQKVSVDLDLEKYLQKPFEFPPYVPQPNLSVTETCPKCGIRLNGVMGYVCSSINCPTYYQTTCDTSIPMHAKAGPQTSQTTGAIGSEKEYDARGWRTK